MSSVFFTPKCPINPPPCASCNNSKWMELAGMHSLLALNTIHQCGQICCKSFPLYNSVTHP
uniref:Uncharacterized protein n=1 Tax=Arundo donax TaxID=35708 RepID=A0A0A9CNA3_ARUDO